MENPINYLIKNVCSYFLLENANVDEYKNAISLIRIHNEKLKDIGDISFPISASIWQNYFAKTGVIVREELLKKLFDKDTIKEAKTHLLTNASKWLYPVQTIRIEHGRCALLLQRNVIVETLLNQVLCPAQSRNNYGITSKLTQRRLCLIETALDAENANDLSRYRASLVFGALQRILAYSAWNIVATNQADEETLQVEVSSVVNNVTKLPETTRACGKYSVIKCGLVRDPATGKLAKLTTSEYLSLRSSDMRLMAMHKYGIRAKDDKRFCALMERMGAAAVNVDLLEVKHSSPVQIIRNGQGSSTKGASFILYNSARLETLLRTFDERVANGMYGQLPTLDAINFDLLCEEEEWQLLFGYIMQFPQLIERCLENIAQGSCGTHLIVRYLSGFVAVFSVYYRRIRILTEQREHLMPFVYARIYLIKATRHILNKTLALLNIEPVMFM